MSTKITLNKELNPLLCFSKIAKFKKVFKPIKVVESDIFLENIIKRAELLLSCLWEDITVPDMDNYDYDYLDLTCTLYCNIPIEFSARVNGGSNCWISGYKKNGEQWNEDYKDKKGLLEVLDNIVLPQRIDFTKIIIEQKIGDYKSSFSFTYDG